MLHMTLLNDLPTYSPCSNAPMGAFGASEVKDKCRSIQKVSHYASNNDFFPLTASLLRLAAGLFVLQT